MEWVHFLPLNQKNLLDTLSQDAQRHTLISGAPGTGKGQIARWIHFNGPRASKPMMIGHHRFALAQQLLEARDGSLVLQEIGEWPLSDQKAVLQHIQKGQGARIIATTDQNLEKRSLAGLFNSELLSLLAQNRLEMPALSKRSTEFEPITQILIQELSREIGKPSPEVSESAWRKLKAYDWPGNLRELRNVLKVALTTCQGGKIEEKDFPQFGYDRTEFHATREAFEKTYLEELLKTCQGNVQRAVELSGIPQSTMLAKIQKYGLT
jgi:DNA-binding NtrC family response regulator